MPSFPMLNDAEMIVAIDEQQQKLFMEQRQKLLSQTDKMFAVLFIFQWLMGIVFALVISPRTWIGNTSYLHLHVFMAVFLGALIIAMPLYLIWKYPGESVTRYAIAIAQALYSTILIHLTGGRIETHFHVFGSLAFLSFYRDWRVLLTATAVLTLDHFLRGVYFPESVFGAVSSNQWRWMEHAAWVVFEDVFLIYACCQGIKDMRNTAHNQAELEITKSQMDKLVVARTKSLTEMNASYEAEIERRRASEEALKEKTRNLDRALSLQHALMNNIPDMAWIKDRDLKFVLCNEPFAKTVNSAPDDLVGKTDYDYWPADLAEQYAEDDRLVMVSGERKQREEEFENQDGSRIWIHTVKTPIRDETTGEIVGTVGISRDITDQRYATVELEKAYTSLKQEATERQLVEKQLVQSQKMQAIGTLTGGIAHDFNNILWMILGNSEMLLSELEGNEVCLEMTQDIHSAADRAKSLVQQLLDFSRKSESEKIYFSPTSLLKETLKMLRSTIPSRIEIKTVNLSLPFQVYGDPNKFHQVIVNLCTNAYHAIADKGSLTVSMDEIRISPEDIGNELFKKPGHFMCVQVYDTGCGMTPETLERIFEPFFTTKEVGKGTGLGLSTVLGIVEEMDGFITVDSEPGAGSSFKLHLPIQSANEQPSELLRVPETMQDRRLAS